MKVVVTGATGFLGVPLVQRLLEGGALVTVLSRDAARAETRLPGVRAIEANLEALGPWTHALEGADAIVHLAGESIGGKRWDARQKQVLRDSRVEATRTIVEAIEALPSAARPRALICASAVDYYAFASGRTEFDDDDVTEADPSADTFLGRLCRDWEREALAAEALGLRVVCMRTGIVLGPGGGALAKLAGPFQKGFGGPIGSGFQFMSWIHLEDAVAAYATAVTDERYLGPINLVAGSIRNADFARTLAAALGKRSWLRAPAFAVKLAAGELADYLLNGRNVVPARLRALGLAFRHPDLSDAAVFRL